MSTGRSSFAPLLFALALAVLLACSTSPAATQTLRLRALSIPGDTQVGRWVSYQVRLRTQNRAPREFSQRIAVVAREGSGEESGIWIELKTVDAGTSRIERGFYVRPRPEGDEPAADTSATAAAMAPPLRLARYQVLTPQGRLFEYHLGSDAGGPPEEDVSAIDIMEFAPPNPQDRDSLGPDTLRVGRKVVPCERVRVRRYSSAEWPDGSDSLATARAVMAQTYWLNSAIPITGYAKSVLEVSTQRFGPAGTTPPSAATAPPESTRTAPAESTAAAGPASTSAPVPTASATGARLDYRGELTLLDVGTGAVPEVTQEPELPSDEEPAPGSRLIR